MQGNCEGPAPASFGLTEPVPAGACAVRVREDFLDAPLGTTCLLLDSLYMVVAPRTPLQRSSVLVLHVRRCHTLPSCAPEPTVHTPFSCKTRFCDCDYSLWYFHRS